MKIIGGAVDANVERKDDMPKLRNFALCLITFGFTLISCEVNSNRSFSAHYSGTIAQFGSIVINGVHLDTTGASFYSNGTLATQSSLKVGMQVHVKGEHYRDATTGIATVVSYQKSVEGEIDGIVLSSNVMTVLSQVVHIDERTVFDGRDFDQLAIGHVVEISGYLDSNSEIHATRIAYKKASFSTGLDELEIVGTIASFNSLAENFRLNALLVDFSASSFTNIPSNVLAADMYVKVKSTTGLVGGELIANEIIGIDNPYDPEIGNTVEYVGLISRFADAEDFDLGEQGVITDSLTRFVGGSTSDLALGSFIEVEGRINSQDLLLADRVRIRAASEFTIEADLEDFDTDTLVLELYGFEVHLDDLTHYRDTSSAALSEFSIADLAVGDHLEIRATIGSNDRLYAHSLERQDSSVDTLMRAAVESVEDPDLIVRGKLVTTSVSTNFFDASGNSISAATFFAAVGVGDIIEIDGGLSGTTLVAQSIHQK